MKKILTILLLINYIFFVNINQTFPSENKDTPYTLKQGYDIYKERVSNICDEYKTTKEVIKIEDKFKKIDWSFDLDSIKNTYKENMNDIYKCALLNVQKKSLKIIKNDLTKKNPVLLKTLGPKIDSKIALIDSTIWAMKCKNTEDVSSVIKLNVLQQSTYETCKYHMYLEYLKEKNESISSLIPKNSNKTSVDNILKKRAENDDAIEKEIDHVYKVFPMAFHALWEYENNITIHFLLELIKDDYMILREKLHEVLNPINQVVYKISNAMRK